MKNSEIHAGFDKREIRDLIALEFVKSYEEEVNNKKDVNNYNSYKKEPLVWAIKEAEAQIKFLRRHIEINKKRVALLELSKICGWTEYDVSDETERDHDYSYYMSFFGTEEEYQELMRKLNKK
jgi:hypothetical protein